MKQPFPIVLSAPSGGGKTAITKRLLERRPDVGYSVSCTTRLPRAGETDGKDYYFLTVGEFETRRDRGDFAEWAEVHGRLYGTLRREVDRVLSLGHHVLMDIDVQGAAQFKRAFPEAVTVFILPPSTKALIQRLTARRTESTDSLERRIRSALAELKAVPDYEYVVVNDELEAATARVDAIIEAEGARRVRLSGVAGLITELTAGLERELERPR